jgi:hypothetical protein
MDGHGRRVAWTNVASGWVGPRRESGMAPSRPLQAPADDVITRADGHSGDAAAAPSRRLARRATSRAPGPRITSVHARRAAGWRARGRPTLATAAVEKSCAPLTNCQACAEQGRHVPRVLRARSRAIRGTRSRLGSLPPSAAFRAGSQEHQSTDGVGDQDDQWPHPPGEHADGAAAVDSAQEVGRVEDVQG